ncbi:hypothetical protein V6N13_038423 [Hibiscus sabdariffa]|uniref:Uncharacterized protein n=1 Tax=Hibiscus sabdariffa TaxID=183260 RepID=A0ABR2S212_9ROSI
MSAPTSQSPDLDLNHINQSQHQKQTTGNRPSTGNHHADPKQRLVNIDVLENLGAAEIDADVEGMGFGELDCLLEGQSYEAGEEERAEGVDVEFDQILGDFRAGKTFGGWVYENVAGIVGIPG